MDGESGTPKAATHAPSAADATQRRIDRYELRQELGTGAMGAVYAAYDPKLMREVALKVVAQNQQDNDKGRTRFVREAHAVAAIHHPNVVQIYDYSGTDSSTLYLVMEKLEGQDLWNLMHQNGALPEATVLAIGHELCLALEQTHAHHIIHRDLKPENVFLTDGGRVVLTDFGIVKALADDAPVDGYRERTEVIGTPGFMAPELMRGKALGPATDIFALGVLLYNVATLKMPFTANGPVALYQQVQRGDYTDPRQYQPLLSPAFCALIAQCLQFSPKKRPQNAAALRLLLQAALNELGSTELRDDCLAYVQDPEGFAQRSLRRASRHTLACLRAAVAAGQDDDRRRLAARARVLAPFDDEVDRILAAAPPETAAAASAAAAVTATVGTLGKAATAGLTHLRGGADWLLSSAGRSHAPAAPAPPVAAPAGGAAPARSRRARAAGPMAAAVVLAGLVMGSTGVALVLAKPSAAGRHAANVTLAYAPGASSAAACRPDAAATPWWQGAPPANKPETATKRAAPESAAGLAAAADAPNAVVDAGAVADAASAAHVNLAVAASGRGAWLRLDGRAVGFVHATRLTLRPGRHVLELVARGGHRLRRHLNLQPGDERALHVNFTRPRRR